MVFKGDLCLFIYIQDFQYMYLHVPVVHFHLYKSVNRDGKIIVIFYYYKRNIKSTECASSSDLCINSY